jgi:hypothetical protein
MPRCRWICSTHWSGRQPANIPRSTRKISSSQPRSHTILYPSVQENTYGSKLHLTLADIVQCRRPCGVHGTFLCLTCEFRKINLTTDDVLKLRIVTVGWPTSSLALLGTHHPQLRACLVIEFLWKLVRIILRDWIKHLSLSWNPYVYRILLNLHSQTTR